MKLTHRLVFSFLALAVIWAAMYARPSSTQASCAGVPSLSRALAAAPIAFVGKVTATRKHSMVARVRVLDVWRGRQVPKISVVENDSPEDIRTFQAGVVYLFVPEPTSTKSPYLDDACTATRRYSPTLAKYRSPGAHRP